jgi:hypothetical protein
MPTGAGRGAQTTKRNPVSRSDGRINQLVCAELIRVENDAKKVGIFSTLPL